jgi:hypothetical protein
VSTKPGEVQAAAHPPRSTTPTPRRRARPVIERSFAWLIRFRRLAIRYERRLDIHTFTAVAFSLICLNALQAQF